jgi:hypothetical protein
VCEWSSKAGVKMSNTLMGELRSLLAAPSSKSWEQIGALLSVWPDAAALTEQVVPYVERALVDWPDAVWRQAPASWVGVDAPLYRLCRPLALPLVLLDMALWQEAVSATEALSEEDATQNPASVAKLVEDTYPGTMRANALALRHYLTEGLGLVPTVWRVEGGDYRRILHHGDLHVSGDFSFLRGAGTPGASLITGDLVVEGTISGSAFEGELMVGGDVRCFALICDADLAIGGALISRYVRLAWYDCAWAMGDVHADVFIEHSMGLVDLEPDAPLWLQCEDHDTSLNDELVGQLYKLLSDEVLAALMDVGDEDDDDRMSALYEQLDEVLLPRLLAGEPIFVDPTLAPTRR